MERGAVIIVENAELLLIERVRNGRTYYLFPGGGVEAGETREQAAIREAYEELGLQVALGRLVAVVTHEGSQQYYFLATALGGQFGTGTGDEFQSPPDSEGGSYLPVRLPLERLLQYDVRPEALAERLVSEGFLETAEILYLTD